MKRFLYFLTFYFPMTVFGQESIVRITDYPLQLQPAMEELCLANTYVPYKYSILKVDGKKIKTSLGLYGKYLYDYVDRNEEKMIYSLEMGYNTKGSLIIWDRRGEKDAKLGTIKIKPSEEENANYAFSADGKQVIALKNGNIGAQVYVFDISSKKTLVNGKEINISENVNSVHAIASSGNGKDIYGISFPDVVFHINIETGTSKSNKLDLKGINAENYSYLYTSTEGNFLALSNKYYTYIIDTKTLKVIFVKLGDESHESDKIDSYVKWFITSSGDIKESLTTYKIKEDGVGLFYRENDAVIFDNFQNFYMVSKTDKPTDIGDYISLGELNKPLAYSSEIIPFASEVLSSSAKYKLLEKIALKGHDGDYNFKNREMTYKLFSMIEPFDGDLLKEISTKSGMGYLRAYAGSDVVRWVNESNEDDLADESKELAKKKAEYLRWYAGIVKENHGLLNGLTIASQNQIQSAINKLIPYSEGIQNMTVQEMIDRGNSILVSTSSLATNAALMAIMYYEKAQEKEPFDPIHAVNIGNAYLMAHQYEHAAQNYNKALAIKPDYPLALYGLMRTVHEPVKNRQTQLNPNIAGSISNSAKRFLEVAPSNYDYEIEIARKIGGTMDLFLIDMELYHAYHNVSKIKPDSKRSFEMGNLAFQLEAVGAKYLAADLAFTTAEYYRVSAENQGNREGYYIMADGLYEEASHQDVMNAKAYYNWANINLTYLKRFDEGKKIVSLAKKKFPGDDNFNHLGAVIGYHTGTKAYLASNFTEAIPNLENYLKNPVEQSSMARPYLGISYFMVKKYPEATETLNKCKEEEKLNTLKAYFPNFESIMAFAKNPSGTAPSVQDNSKKIKEIQDIYQAAQKLESEGKLESALIQMIPCSTYFNEIDYDVGQAIVFSGMGAVSHKSDDLESAKNYYQLCIDNGAQSSSCYNNLAMIKMNDGKLSESKRLLDEGNELYPNASNLKLTFADYYMERGFEDYRNKYYSSAISNLKKSIEYSDDDPVTRVFLGFAYYADGSVETSKRIIKEALQMDPSLRQQYEAIDQILNK